MASRASSGQRQRSPTSVASPPAGGGPPPQAAVGAGVVVSKAKNHVTPPQPKQQRKSRGKKHPDMIVQKSIVNELLLVCSVIGSSSTTTDPTTGQIKETFVPVDEALNWLQDLQRALRRDHETYRPVSLLLGQWRVVAQKLLPLVMSCRYDKAMVMTVCKILVILTKPLSEDAKRAGRLIVDVKSGKVDER